MGLPSLDRLLDINPLFAITMQLVRVFLSSFFGKQDYL